MAAFMSIPIKSNTISATELSDPRLQPTDLLQGVINGRRLPVSEEHIPQSIAQLFISYARTPEDRGTPQFGEKVDSRVIANVFMAAAIGCSLVDDARARRIEQLFAGAVSKIPRTHLHNSLKATIDVTQGNSAAPAPNAYIENLKRLANSANTDPDKPFETYVSLRARRSLISLAAAGITGFSNLLNAGAAFAEGNHGNGNGSGQIIVIDSEKPASDSTSGRATEQGNDKKNTQSDTDTTQPFADATPSPSPDTSTETPVPSSFENSTASAAPESPQPTASGSETAAPAPIDEGTVTPEPSAPTESSTETPVDNGDAAIITPPAASVGDTPPPEPAITPVQQQKSANIDPANVANALNSLMPSDKAISKGDGVVDSQVGADAAAVDPALAEQAGEIVAESMLTLFTNADDTETTATGDVQGTQDVPVTEAPSATEDQTVAKEIGDALSELENPNIPKNSHEGEIGTSDDESENVKSSGEKDTADQAFKERVADLVRQSGTPISADKIYDMLTKADEKYNHKAITRELVLSMAYRESLLGKLRHPSSAGARGFVQFMPGTWGDWGKGKDIMDDEANIDAAFRYMINIYNSIDKKFPHASDTMKVRLALSGYNAGPRFVYRYGKLPKNSSRSYANWIYASAQKTYDYIDKRVAQLQKHDSANNDGGKSEARANYPYTSMIDGIAKGHALRNKYGHGVSGKLPDSELKPFNNGYGSEKRMIPEATDAFLQMSAAFNKKFGHNIPANSAPNRSYRPLSGQHSGSLSAAVGKSRHGDGTAIDLGFDANWQGWSNLTEEQLFWLRDNAYKWGFVQPPWALKGASSKYEPWHWEFWGKLAGKQQWQNIRWYMLENGNGKKLHYDGYTPDETMVSALRGLYG